jgi:beta-lactamase superfamily II metal-dependent hydrolase
LRKEDVIVKAFKGRVAIDLMNVLDKAEGGRVISTLAWGDEVRVLGTSKGRLKVSLRTLGTGGASAVIKDQVGFVKPPSKSSGIKLTDIVTPKAQKPGVLKFDTVDVQQGDGAVLETADGTVVLIDGGDNQLFARYLAARFRGTSSKNRKAIDCIVVTHGDADHFSGLTRIHDSETHKGAAGAPASQKKLFIKPKRVYHNGLVKRPGKINKKTVAEKDMFGKTVQSRGRRFIVELKDDLRNVSPSVMNVPFTNWRKALVAWSGGKKKSIVMKRLSRRIDGGGNSGGADPFDFLAAEGIKVEVLGPLEHRVGGKPALPFLGSPNPKAERQPGKPQVSFSGLSASHTVNGHSVVLRITYGNCRFLLTGDLNEESESFLTKQHQEGHLDLTSEVFKVPHHGSADFSVPFLRAVSPAVSMISSGDESEQKEFIHPRATLVGALSKQGRATLEEPLVLITELAAFFKVEGWVKNDQAKLTHKTQRSERKDEFFAFSRKSFGIIKIRTDGSRMLVYTYSGKDDMKEAYAFKLQGERVIPEPVRKC